MQCKTGEEGPVRADQVIVRRGCALVYGELDASEMSRVVCLSASEAYLCLKRGRERQTRRYLDNSHERGSSTSESLDASPHLSPLTANCNAFSCCARSSDIMQQCPDLSVVSLHSTGHMPRYGLCSRRFEERVLYYLECSSCSSHVAFDRDETMYVEHLTAANRTFQAKSHVFTHLCLLPASCRQDAPLCLPHDKIERPY